MSHDKDEFAGAGRLTRAIGVSLSADVELPPRPRLLGPLAETPDPVFSQITFPVADAPDADPQEERFVEAVEELGLGEALKALQRKAPGRKADDEIDRYLDPFIKALEASGGSLKSARKKFERFTGLSPDWARKKFTEILRVVKINSGGK
jgi:hypothetical protein